VIIHPFGEYRDGRWRAGQDQSFAHIRGAETLEASISLLGHEHPRITKLRRTIHGSITCLAKLWYPFAGVKSFLRVSRPWGAKAPSVVSDPRRQEQIVVCRQTCTTLPHSRWSQVPVVPEPDRATGRD
jgi:hypothetical protein